VILQHAKHAAKNPVTIEAHDVIESPVITGAITRQKIFVRSGFGSIHGKAAFDSGAIAGAVGAGGGGPEADSGKSDNVYDSIIPILVELSHQIAGTHGEQHLNWSANRLNQMAYE
jgi:hypothetical protein